LPAGATFCLQCGQMYAAAGPGGALVARKGRNAALVSLGVVAAVLAAFAGLSASGLLRFGEMPAQGNLQAPGAQEDSGLTRRADEPDQTLAATDTKITMPADVRAWLEHLERIEKKKNAIHIDQSDNAKLSARMLEGAGGLTSVEDVNTFTDPDASVPDLRVDVTKMFDEMKEPWLALRKEFLNGPRVPAECTALAQSYESGLVSIPGSIDELTAILKSFNPTDTNARKEADSARSSARNVGQTHRANVDRSFIKADDQLEAICRKYETKKWFDIHSGTLGGSGLAK
jgi:hypothetical protein